MIRIVLGFSIDTIYTLMGLIFAELNIHGINFRKFFGLKFGKINSVKFFENGKFAKIILCRVYGLSQVFHGGCPGGGMVPEQFE